MASPGVPIATGPRARSGFPKVGFASCSVPPRPNARFWTTRASARTYPAREE